MNNIETSTMARFLLAKSIKKRIEDASYSLSILTRNKRYNELDDVKEIKKLTDAFELIIDDLVKYLRSTNYGKQKPTA